MKLCIIQKQVTTNGETTYTKLGYTTSLKSGGDAIKRLAEPYKNAEVYDVDASQAFIGISSDKCVRFVRLAHQSSSKYISETMANLPCLD